MRYFVQFLSFGYYHDMDFATLAEAVAYAKSTGFETAILRGESQPRAYGPKDGVVVAVCSALGGTKYCPPFTADGV